MNVVLDGRIINDRFPGMGRYTIRLAEALAREGQVDLTLLIHPSLPNTRYALEAPSGISIRPVAIAPFSIAEQTHLPALAQALRPDVWHAPYYSLPYRRLGCPTLVTFYDTIPLALPQLWSARQRLFFRWAHRLALRVATRAIAISESTRRDLVRFFRADPARIDVTPLAADDKFKPQPASEVRRVHALYPLPDRFLLYVGINKPPKNLPRLIRAFAQIGPVDFGCVIAGAWDERYPQTRQLAYELGLGNRVQFLGPVPDADLPALYSAADLFVTASLYEGFGLPALEAMACGTPVVCSRAASLPEVVGGAGLLFDPLDVDAIAGAMQRGMSDPALWAELRRRGLERAAQFSWERAARQTVESYRRARGEP